MTGYVVKDKQQMKWKKDLKKKRTWKNIIQMH